MSEREADRQIVCAECGREVSEDEAERERWGFWSDGTGDLLPHCPAREFRPGIRSLALSGTLVYRVEYLAGGRPVVKSYECETPLRRVR